MSFTTASLPLMGFDFLLEIDFTQTYKGFKGSFYEPPEDPEFEIDSLVLRLDEPGHLGAPFEATGQLFNVLSTSRAVDDAILTYLENSNDLDWLEYDEDFYRER